MKKMVIFVSLGLLVVFCLANVVESTPIAGLQGVWKGTAHVVGRVAAGAPTNYYDVPMVIKINDQQGDRFSGTVTIGQPGNQPPPPGENILSGVIYNNTLHIITLNKCIIFGELAPSKIAPIKPTIQGYWNGGTGLADSALFSVTKQ
jgi:hypothetical protein